MYFVRLQNNIHDLLFMFEKQDIPMKLQRRDRSLKWLLLATPRWGGAIGVVGIGVDLGFGRGADKRVDGIKRLKSRWLILLLIVKWHILRSALIGLDLIFKRRRN